MEKGKRGEMLRTPAEPRVEAGKMQEARSSFAGKRVDEGEKEEWLQGEHQLGLSRKKSH